MSTSPVDLINAPAGQTEGYFQAIFTSQWGVAAGEAYAKFNASNPGSTPYQNAKDFETLILVEGLDKGIASALTGTAKSSNAEVTGAAQGANQNAKDINQILKDLNPLNDLDIFNWIASITGFSGTNFVIRAVKVIVGGVLLISGIIHLAGIDKDALGVASKAVVPIP